MRSKKQLTACMLLTALLANTALAADTSEPNVFNADTSHPDLAAAISAFEETCMPFVLHETEMDREHDKLHMAKLMKSRGFAFKSSALKANRVVVEPGREEWRPASQAINPNGITIVNQTGEIDMTPWIPPVYEVKTYEYEVYTNQNQPRLQAHIRWTTYLKKTQGNSAKSVCRKRLCLAAT